MAREAGFSETALEFYIQTLEHLAALVASAAQAKEREACAKVCERTKEATTDLFEKAGAHKCATAIRARGQA